MLCRMVRNSRRSHFGQGAEQSRGPNPTYDEAIDEPGRTSVRQTKSKDPLGVSFRTPVGVTDRISSEPNLREKTFPCPHQSACQADYGKEAEIALYGMAH